MYYTLSANIVCVNDESLEAICDDFAARCHKKEICPCGVFDCPFRFSDCSEVKPEDWRKLFKAHEE